MNSAPNHSLPSFFYHRAIHIHVIGCGGTGSQFVARLPSLHKSLLALGHPEGLQVTVWDDDTVAAHNTVRQNFFLADVGRPKSAVTVNRINIAHNLRWQAQTQRFHRDAFPNHQAQFIVGCVDTKAARREIDAFMREAPSSVYWIDAGNEADSGQIVVGQGMGRDYGVRNDGPRLPLVTEDFPEIIEGEDDNHGSCSAQESILRQGIATNSMAATLAFSWLSEALRNGSCKWRGAFFSLDQGRVSPLPVPAAA